jgi:hypothetical protein
MANLNSLRVDHLQPGSRVVNLSSGTLLEVLSDTPTDYLIISSKPNDYHPAQGGAVQELSDLKVSVAELEKNPAMDFRPLLPCWVSSPITTHGIGRLVVFEPHHTFIDQSTETWKAFQAVKLFSGSATPSTVAVALFTSPERTDDPSVSSPKKIDDPAVRLRMAFYAAASLTARTESRAVNIIVPTATASSANGTFEVLKASYFETPDVPETTREKIEQLSIQHPGLKKTPAPKGVPPESLGLTERQYQALFDYTSTSYTWINRPLRAGDITAADFAYFQSSMEAISTGLAQMKNYLSNGLDLIRRLGTFPGIEDLFTVGATTIEAAYTSTSNNPDYPYNGDYQVKMLGHTGKYIAPLSNFPNEGEVLFDHGMGHLVFSIAPITDPAPMIEVRSNQVLPNTSNINFSQL